MKKSYSICTSLGFTQQDMAMVLRVTRSQWAMFESGKRNLPLPAMKLLTEMLTHSKSSEKTADMAVKSNLDTFPQQQYLKNLARDNEYQQMLLSKKIAAANKRLEVAAKQQQLVAFLYRHTDKNNLEAGVLRLISEKASKTLSGNDAIELSEYEIKKELLEVEKLAIESKLRKLKQSIKFGDADF